MHRNVQNARLNEMWQPALIRITYVGHFSLLYRIRVRMKNGEIEKEEDSRLFFLKLIFALDQACQTGGPRAACGPFACFVRPE